MFEYEIDGELLLTPQAHCDNRVLHKPGVCEYCDAYPQAQEQRMRLSVAFTGEQDSIAQYPCPAMAVRDMDSLNGWGGNQPHGPGVTEEEITHFEQIERPSSIIFYGPTRERHSRGDQR